MITCGLCGGEFDGDREFYNPSHECSAFINPHPREKSGKKTITVELYCTVDGKRSLVMQRDVLADPEDTAVWSTIKSWTLGRYNLQIQKRVATYAPLVRT